MTMMKKKYIILAIILFTNLAFSQVGINTSTPDDSSVLDITSTNNDKGLYIPRVSLTSLNSNTTPINNPATGLMVYNIGTNHPVGIYYWTGTQWLKFNVGGDFDEVLSIVNNNGVSKLVTSTTTSNITDYVVKVNTLAGASFTTDATNGDYVTLPKGVYNVKVRVDAKIGSGTLSGYYTSNSNNTGTQANIKFGHFSVDASLVDANSGIALSDIQTSGSLSGGLVGFSYNFWLNLSSTTNVKLKLVFSSAGNTDLLGVPNLFVQQNGAQVIYLKMQ